MAIDPVRTNLSNTHRPVLYDNQNRLDQPVKDSGPNRPHATKTAIAR
ncbi:hypothetical protein J2S53_002416 [Actinopolyspora lacussalsi]|nr:hypothetical protein [Actinopolyspora lacussalsi]